MRLRGSLSVLDVRLESCAVAGVRRHHCDHRARGRRRRSTVAFHGGIRLPPHSQRACRSFAGAFRTRLPVLPTDASILACSATGEPAVFQLRENCVGFLDHPAIKAGMTEDPVMAWTSRKPRME